MTPAAVETPVPVPPPSPSSSTAAGAKTIVGTVTAPSVLEISSAIYPKSRTPNPAVDADTASSTNGSNSTTITIALVVAGAVAMVLAAAVFVYAKTVRRHDELKRELGSLSSRLQQTTGRSSLHEPYQQLSPRPPGYDAYLGGVANGRTGTNTGPPLRAAQKRSDVSPRAHRASSDRVTLNDPAFDVLTPLSDIATVGGGLADSFNGGASMNYAVKTETDQSSSRSVFYDPNRPLSPLSPGHAIVVRPLNDVTGSDSDSDSDLDSVSDLHDNDVAPLSFDSDYDSSGREWADEAGRARAESNRSAAFSIGSEDRESSVIDIDSQRSLVASGRKRQESVASTGLHDHDASVSSYSELMAHLSADYGDRSTATSDLNEYAMSDLERFDSHVFSDVGADDESYREDSYADVVVSAANGSGGGGVHSFSSSSSDGDDIDGSYDFDDSDRGDIASSFSSTSSYEV